MALDGATLSILKDDINRRAADSHVEKVFMPYRDQIMLLLSKRGFSGRLLISCNPTSPRLHFTQEKTENPSTPPMFCMLLRKRLAGGRLRGARQAGLDRVLFLDFDCKNELGDAVTFTVIVEIMGRASNIIVESEGKIIDAVRRVDPQEGRRFILPGAAYELPPAQDKINFLTRPPEEILARVRIDAQPVAKALMACVDGVSPIVCRELAARACRGENPPGTAIDDEQAQKLCAHLSVLKDTVAAGGRPTLVLDPDGRPRDFTFLPVTQYGTAAMTREYPDFGVLMDAFYTAQDNRERMRQRSQDLLKTLTNLTERTARKIEARRAELQKTEDRERLRQCGELIKANLHAIRPGDSRLVAVNYYDPDCSETEIPLDVTLSPSQNAQKYFKEYRKAATAAQLLGDLIVKAEADLVYFDSVFDALSRAESAAELQEIRAELTAGGYLKGQKGGAVKLKTLPPLRFVSSDGFSILVGRNNRQNDELTLKTAAKTDYWLHTKNIPGSHVIIETQGQTPPDTTLTEAAILAAVHSKAADSAMVPVEYAMVKYVKKPAGAKPGMVIYTNNKTAYVNPDKTLPEKLKG